MLEIVVESILIVTASDSSEVGMADQCCTSRRSHWGRPLKDDRFWPIGFGQASRELQRVRAGAID